MALPATDNFNGTTGDALTTYSSNWTINDGGFDIQSSAVAPDAAGGDHCAHWNADTFDDDQYSEITRVAVGTTWFGVTVRASTSAADTFYIYRASSSAKELNRVLVGARITLASDATGVSVNDVQRIEAEGTTITPMLNGSEDTGVGAQTDSSISSGAAGIGGFGNSTTTRGDDWEGGDLGGGGGLSIPVAMFHYTQQGIA